MQQNLTILDALTNPLNNTTSDTQVIQHYLSKDGVILLRNFEHDLDSFSQLINQLCTHVTFDPARKDTGLEAQKVDAGTDAIGLHIENGNTPFPPDIVAFYCAKSARSGSQTTVCDGKDLWHALPERLRQQFSHEITVTRTLPESLWKRYIANEHPEISTIEQVRPQHLQHILTAIPHQNGQLNADGSLFYQLTITPCLSSNFARQPAFANALLGPSFNYEPPKYYFADGSRISDEIITEIAAIAETITQEINWQDGDIAIIDNKRVMHGRREITDAERRQLYIGMGMAA